MRIACSVDVFGRDAYGMTSGEHVSAVIMSEAIQNGDIETAATTYWRR